MKRMKKALHHLKLRFKRWCRRCIHALNIRHLDESRYRANQEPDDIAAKHMYAQEALRYWNLYMRKGDKYGD